MVNVLGSPDSNRNLQTAQACEYYLQLLVRDGLDVHIPSSPDVNHSVALQPKDSQECDL